MSAFAHDRTSGAGDVALGFLAELERWLAIDRSTSAPALRLGLLAWLKQAQASQPTMALVHQFAARALEVADTALSRGETPAELRSALALSCAAERSDLSAARRAVARQAAVLVTEAQRLDRDALDERHGARRGAGSPAHRARAARAGGRGPKPRLEGRAAAAALAEAGVPVWLVVDAALPLLLSQARMVWLGADAVTDQGVMNKLGSFAAALAAREHSVPVYALAERRKFLPAATPALRIVEMPPEEVWEEPAAGVEPRNIYFERVPLPLLRGVVVEDAVLPPGETAALARERPLPGELAGI